MGRVEPTTQTLAHISDLHIGRDPGTDRAAADLCGALVAAGVELLMVTGDVTHRGRQDELERFEHIFAPLIAEARLVVVPGNHDRLGDDAAAQLMSGGRVLAAHRGGVYAVRLDSTGPHNRYAINSHGLLEERDIDDVERALAVAPTGALRVVLLHHHLLPLPADHLGERVASFLGWPHAEELPLGERLLARIRGSCDAILHGHRHRPSDILAGDDAGGRLPIFNAGSTTALGRARLLHHSGGVIRAMSWLEVGPRRGGAVHAHAEVRARGAALAA